MKPTIVTLTGPSCAGKTTLETMLRARGYEPVVSTTTRQPRFGEYHGTSYYFMDEAEFLVRKENGEFIESVEFNGSYYGISKDEIERVAKRGQPIVIVVEPHGHKQIKAFAEAMDWKILSVFVNNPQEVIFYRFLRRFAILTENTKNRIGTLEREAKRLTTMQQVEHAWIAEAFMDESKKRIYDLQFHQFGADTETQVILKIQAEVSKLTEEVQKAA